MRRLQLIAKFRSPFRLLPLAVLACFGCLAGKTLAQPANDLFANATAIGGQFGSVLGSNVGATNELNEPSHGGFPARNSIWYAWTAPEDGEVTFDTLGSTNSVGWSLDTVVAAYIGSSLSQMLQVAANDDYYPFVQSVYTTLTDGTTGTRRASPLGNPSITYFPLLYFGPSILRFNAKAGTTYYIAVDTKSPAAGIFLGTQTGTISLSWAFRSSGAFRFGSEEFDVLNWNGRGMPKPLFQCTEAESSPDTQSTHDSYYKFDPEGVLVTVSRIAGSAGRMLVDYTTKDGTALAGVDYRPIAGTLVFDDFEMSKTLRIQIVFPGLYASTNNPDSNPWPPGGLDRDFSVVLSNPRPAPLESPNVSPPRLDTAFASATVHIISFEGLGDDPNQNWTGDTLDTPPSHDVYGFWHKNYRVPRDINNYWTMVHLTVDRVHNRAGRSDFGATLNYRINGTLANGAPPQQWDNFFALNPGSDYAIPFPAEACNWIYPWQDVTNWNNWDFQMAGNTPSADGTITIPDIGFASIDFMVRNDSLTKFNKDFLITLYRNVDGAARTVGEVSECRVTILFDDAAPPAGSVDEFYNTDFGGQMKPPVATIPSNQAHPGTDGTVWALAVQQDATTILAGEFGSYNGTTRRGITRVLPSGAIDLSFDPGTGANDGLVSSLALLPDGSGSMVIGGSFTHFNSGPRPYINRLLSTGQRDTTFNPPQDPNGTVWALAVQPNNKIIIAGDFTYIGNVPRPHIARLNADGSLDTTFDPTTNAPDDTVWSVALQPDGKILIGGQFLNLGTQPLGGLARLNSNGTSDAAFNTALKSGVDGTVYSVVLQNGSDIVIGGEFQQVAISQRTRIARLHNNGVVDDTFNTGIGADDTIYNIAAQPDGSMYVGGIFTSFNGTHRLGLTRLYPDGSVDTTFLDTAYNQFAGLHRRYFDRQTWPGPGPDPNPDPRPFVNSSQVLPDGTVVIGGGFKQVGGGQADASIRFDPDYPYSQIDTNVWTEPKSRDGVRNRNNFARLIGGATPGPGNLSLLYTNYLVNRSQLTFDVDLIRTNGSLGYVSANFAPLAGQAQSGVDYVYNNVAPLYIGSWWPDAGQSITTSYFPDTPHSTTRAHADGFFGTNTLPVDVYGHYWFGYTSAKVTMPIKNSGVAGNIGTTIQLANPSGSDQFFLGAQNIPLGNALGVSAAPLTLVDDTVSPGSIGFASAVYTVNEQGTNVVISIVRTNGTANNPSVSFSTSDGTAHAGSNYVAVLNKRVSFPPGVAVLTNIVIPILDDGASEPNGMTVNLRLSSPQGATLGLANAVLKIIDNDYAPGFVTFSAANYTNTESSGTATVVVNRSGANRGTVTVQCGTADLTAVNGLQYRGLTNTFTWNDGDASPRYLNVPLVKDGLVGSNSTFRVFLFNPTVDTTNSPGSILAGSPINATVQIVDDDYFGQLAFSTTRYLVNENGGYATLVVNRTGGAAEALSVHYTTSNGTAVAQGTLPNFVATSGTLTFNPGEVSKSFTVPLLDDGVVDPANFFFNVQLFGLNPANASLGFPSTAQVFIRDAEVYNFPPGGPDTSFNPIPGFDGNILSLSLQPNGQIIAGGVFTTVDNYPRGGIARLNPNASLDLSFLAGLAGARGGPINATLVQTDGRIVVGGGFTNFNSNPVNRLVRLLADGSLDSSFTLSAGGDNDIYAVAETFLPDRRLLIGGGFVQANGALHPGLARLNNNGSIDTSFNPDLSVNGTVYALAVYPTNSLQAGKIVIGGDFTSINGSTYNRIARLNSDGTIDTTFNMGGAGASDTVRALALQPDGMILVGGGFTNFNGAALTHIARLQISGALDPAFNPSPGPDDTVLQILLQPDNRIVLAGQFSHANGVSRSRITRLMPDGTVDTSINFGTGANNFISALALQPADGMLLVGGGFTQFDSQPRSHLARLYGQSISGAGNFEFIKGDFQVDESSTNAIITVRRAGGTTGNVSVNFATSDGTAHAGVNYSNVAQTLYFPNGETLQTVIVPVVQDFRITPDLVVNLALSNPLPPSRLGDQPVGTLTLINDDSAVSFDSSAYRVNENPASGFANINVVRQGSVRTTSTVDFMTTTNGTAVLGTNYLAVTNTLVFLPGQSNALAQVPILPTPGVVEGDVTVSLQLTNASHALLFTPDQATLTIVDIDEAPGLFFFSQTNYVVSEGIGIAQITVLRTNGHTGVMNLRYATADGSALAGFKYGSTNGTLTFQDGEVSKTIGIQIFQENQVEGNQTFFLSLASASGPTTNILGPSTVPITISDDDSGVGFSSPIYIATETDPSVTVNINRIGTNGFTTVSYTTTNGTAVAGTNYSPRSGTLTFAPGESVKGLNVGLVHDPRVTGPQSFGLLLFNPSAPAVIFTNNPATIVINDADPGIAFTNANFYTSKSDTNGAVLISVLRSNANTGIVSVNYSTFDGTALAGQDYFPTNGLLTFSNGIALQSFAVRIISNNIVEPDRSFFISLFNPSSPGQVLEPSTATVTITNDIAGLSFSSKNYQVNENGGSATITVLRTGYTNSTVSVAYNTFDESGKAGINYSNVSGVLVFTNGETSRTFSVPVKSDGDITGDTTVGLQLSSLQGRVLAVEPQGATLTISETDGSLILPAGTALISESGPANRSIDPGETVSVMFAFRNASGTNTANLVATLLATNGVSNPSSPQPYGVLTVHGPAIARPFTFTAAATNGQLIQAVFQLTDGRAPTNYAAVQFVVGQSTVLYSNTARIDINDNASANPYPASITVNGLPGQISKAVVTLTNLTHDSPSDIDALLVSPGGQKSLFMAKAGADITVNNITLTFDDSASSSLPQFSQLSSGTFRPTSYAAATPPFPPAATPAPPYASTLSAFNASNPNGVWSLYLIDDKVPYSGVISNGWLLQLTTSTPLLGNADVGVAISASPSPVILTSNLTYTISVTNYGPSTASNVVISDVLPAGVSYISSSAAPGAASTNAARQLVWSIPSLANGGYGTLTLVVQPNVVGLLTNAISVTNAVADLNPEDDIAAAVVTVSSPAADLAISVSSTPNPALTGNNLTYTLIVTNLGPATATAVSVTDTLPSGVTLVSASPAGYAVNGNQVVFGNLGNLGNLGQASATIIVRPNLGGTLTNTVTTSSSVVDPLKLNNTATIKTVVVPIAVSVTRNGAGLVFSWPVEAAGYQLESTSGMQPPVVWVPVPNTPVNINGQMTVTVPIGPGTSYFRLHGQNP